MLGVLFNGYMMYKLGWVNWARLFIWLAIGLVVYFSYGQESQPRASRGSGARHRRVGNRLKRLRLASRSDRPVGGV